ncbi:MAG: LapA family protein [Elusimicrobiota bacterium]
MNQIKLVIYILFAFLVAVFSVYNQETVVLRFFGTQIGISLVIVVLGAILIGVLFTAVLGFLSQSKLKRKIAVLQKLEKELKAKEEKLQLKIRHLEEKLEDHGLEQENHSENIEEEK